MTQLGERNDYEEDLGEEDVQDEEQAVRPELMVSEKACKKREKSEDEESIVPGGCQDADFGSHQSPYEKKQKRCPKDHGQGVRHTVGHGPEAHAERFIPEHVVGEQEQGNRKKTDMKNIKDQTEYGLTAHGCASQWQQPMTNGSKTPRHVHVVVEYPVPFPAQSEEKRGSPQQSSKKDEK
jgi:hypothetical protein